MAGKHALAVRRDVATVEQTLAIIKPDAMSLKTLIYARIVREQIHIVRSRETLLMRQQAENFYREHRGKTFFAPLCDFMSSGDICIYILEGESVITRWRTIIGHTDPVQAARGTLRRMFGTQLPRNAVHGSANANDAQREIDFFSRVLF